MRRHLHRLWLMLRYYTSGGITAYMMTWHDDLLPGVSRMCAICGVYQFDARHEDHASDCPVELRRRKAKRDE